MHRTEKLEGYSKDYRRLTCITQNGTGTFFIRELKVVLFVRFVRCEVVNIHVTLKEDKCEITHLSLPETKDAGTHVLRLTSPLGGKHGKRVGQEILFKYRMGFSQGVCPEA